MQNFGTCGLEVNPLRGLDLGPFGGAEVPFDGLFSPFGVTGWTAPVYGFKLIVPKDLGPWVPAC